MTDAASSVAVPSSARPGLPTCGQSSGQTRGRPGDPGDNQAADVDILWAAKKSPRFSGQALARRVGEAIDISHVTGNGRPTRGQLRGREGVGKPTSERGRHGPEAGQATCTRLERSGPGCGPRTERGPSISYMEGPRCVAVSLPRMPGCDAPPVTRHAEAIARCDAGRRPFPDCSAPHRTGSPGGGGAERAGWRHGQGHAG